MPIGTTRSTQPVMSQHAEARQDVAPRRISSDDHIRTFLRKDSFTGNGRDIHNAGASRSKWLLLRRCRNAIPATGYLLRRNRCIRCIQVFRSSGLRVESGGPLEWRPTDLDTGSISDNVRSRGLFRIGIKSTPAASGDDSPIPASAHNGKPHTTVRKNSYASQKVFRQPDSKYIYGVLVGRVTDGQENSGDKSPHYETLVDAAGTPYRVAVNVRAVDGSNVVAFFDPKYVGDTKLGLAKLAAGPQGFNALTTGVGGQGLDYVRDNLLPLNKMSPIPPDGNGVTLSSLIDAQIERAKRDALAVIAAVGDKFDDNQTTEDVGFALGRGVHDIHMMQGNNGDFQRDNRVNGDGALLLRFAGGEVIALFVRFDTQSTKTDDTGNPRNG